MDAAKKAAGYAAVDRHVKVNFSFDICKLIGNCQSIKVAIYSLDMYESRYISLNSQCF